MREAALAFYARTVRFVLYFQCNLETVSYRATLYNILESQKVAMLYAQEFVEKYSAFVEMLDNVEQPYTFWNESLHAHNLRFWSKRVYCEVMWETKCRCAILSWNLAEDWINELFKLTVCDFLPDNVTKKLNF